MNLFSDYYMVQFVKPNLLGTKSEFNRNFINPIINGQYEDSLGDDIQLMKKRTHVLHRLLKNTVQVCIYTIKKIKNAFDFMENYLKVSFKRCIPSQYP